jgi:hypothetical protein
MALTEAMTNNSAKTWMVAGADKIIRKISAMAIATGCEWHLHIRETRKHMGIFELFRTTVARAEATIPKPDASLHIAAARKLGVEPRNALVHLVLARPSRWESRWDVNGNSTQEGIEAHGDSRASQTTVTMAEATIPKCNSLGTVTA